MTDHTASLEESNAARLPLGYRDSCSALLIPLNKCRRKTFYAPWACEEERFLQRQKKLQALAAEKANEAAEDM
ncbi:nadh:ubiquinone oxidoreductase [Malassezia pachydermatis]|uniref:NADH dehydrogenase [ubiquinone] 1 beta subcomplex subunit 7 n=1 Tax=Malassezia pachydermatis TaxID=77020 RepID=A0A0M8MQE8_9BASI|nr:nadh:ubiquinone oxidoreductase [Malassezia pachydermatis]KOS16248.1 nadh:ubiquinone oxidoreductase [Malassezia pachydermatis]